MKVKKGAADYVENIKDVGPVVTICTVNLCLYIRVKTLNCKHTKKHIFSPFISILSLAYYLISELSIFCGYKISLLFKFPQYNKIPVLL